MPNALVGAYTFLFPDRAGAPGFDSLCRRIHDFQPLLKKMSIRSNYTPDLLDENGPQVKLLLCMASNAATSKCTPRGKRKYGLRSLEVERLNSIECWQNGMNAAEC